MNKKIIELNDFEQVCYELEQGKNDNNESEIRYVKEALKIKINKSYDKFLKIKAESRKSDINEFRAFMLSMCAVIISIFAILISIMDINIISIFLTLLIAVFVILCIQKMTSFDYVSKWREYVIVVLEEIENNKDYFK